MVHIALSDEQRAVVESDANRLAVIAGSGTGKTYTLDALASARPDRRFLYATFSKAAQLDAAARLPGNVQVRTLASLAYSTHGRPLQLQGKLRGSLRAASVVHLFSGPDPTRALLRARFAIQAVAEFCFGLDDSISPSAELCLAAGEAGIARERLHEDAILLWFAMLDLTDAVTPASHDAYFKAWALDGAPGLASMADHFLVDEAQDNNPAADLLFHRLDRPVVYVGDSNQSIYAFRGAVDSLATFPADVRLTLSTSYRFGSAIASLANSLLQHFKHSPLRLVGAGGPDAIGTVQDDLPFAVIARTNAGLFASAIAAVDRGHSIEFVGGFEAYNFERLVDLAAIAMGRVRQCRDPLLRTLGHFAAVEAYAKLTADQDLKAALRVVRDSPGSLAQRVETLRTASMTQHARQPGRGHVSFCTAHRSKGLEFAQVLLADDFPSIYLPDGSLADPNRSCQQEINLQYVAITRACTILQPTPALLRLASTHAQQSRPSSASEAPASDLRTGASALLPCIAA